MLEVFLAIKARPFTKIIIGFGFWVLEFGVWILDFGVWILG
jgi:hypothetical protein